MGLCSAKVDTQCVCVSLLEYVYRDSEKVSWHFGAEQLPVYLIFIS